MELLRVRAAAGPAEGEGPEGPGSLWWQGAPSGVGGAVWLGALRRGVTSCCLFPAGRSLPLCYFCRSTGRAPAGTAGCTSRS